MVVAIARWLINPSEMVWLVHRRVQFLWIGALSLWVLAVRIGLRRGLLLPDAPQILLWVQPWELDIVLADWRRLPQCQRLRPVTQKPSSKNSISPRSRSCWPLSQAVRRILLYGHGRSLEMRDPRQLRVISVLSLFEQQQERLPPA